MHLCLAVASCPMGGPQTGHRRRSRALVQRETNQRRQVCRAQVAAVDAPSTSGAQHLALEEWPSVAPSQLIKDKRAFLEQHRIRGYEVGPDQKTSLVTIANLLQEVAGNHAVAMWGRSEEGFATHPELGRQGIIFVMTRMQIQIECYPRWGDIIQIETWFQEHGKIGAQRDFVITDAKSGQVLGRATTAWVMINMNTRRLTKLPDIARQGLLDMQMQPPANAIPQEYMRQKIPDLELPAEIAARPLVARRADMDMNGHINNVSYLSWALETVPAEVYDSNHLYQIEIDFKAECKAGEVIESLAERGDTQEALANNGAGPGALSFVHLIRRCESPDSTNCTELVRCRTTWRAGEPKPCSD
eukprot:scaffold19.g1791.t1